MMRVFIGCEFSGRVRRAMQARGHYAVSCDLLPADDGETVHHIQGDVEDALASVGHLFDLGIFHPPCTRLANSGNKHLYLGMQKINGRDPVKWAEMEAAAQFFRRLLNLPMPRIALENPVMHGHGQDIIGCGPSQTVQPWQFGHGEIKRTCFWLKNLPALKPTNIVPGRVPRVHHESPGPDRWKRRSITYQGIADAMADQWGSLAAAPKEQP